MYRLFGPLLATVMIAAACGVATQTASDLNVVIPAGGDLGAAIPGRGWDLDSERWKGDCLNYETTTAGSSEASLNFQRSLSLEQLSESLGFSMSGRSRFGVVKGSASARFLMQAQETNYSEVAVYNASYKFKSLMVKNPSLKPGMPTNGIDFAKRCGHEYVSQIEQGAQIFIMVRYDFATSEQKQTFNANFDMKTPATKISGSIDTARQKLKTGFKVTIQAFQVGGQVERLSTIAAGTGASVKDGVTALVECGIDRLDSCKTFLIAALTYAMDERGFSGQARANPSDISYRTASYSDVGAPDASSVVSGVIREKRRTLFTDFELNVKSLSRIIALKGMGLRISQQELSRIESLNQIVQRNLTKLGEAATACWDNIPNCSTAVDNLKLETIHENQFIVKLGPLNHGLYTFRRTVFQSDGNGNFCHYGSSQHFTNGSPLAGSPMTDLPDWDTFQDSMKNNQLCPWKLSRGDFGRNGTVFYSNGAGKFCHYSTFQDLVAFSPTPSQRTELDSDIWRNFMTNSGACKQGLQL